MAYNSLSTGAAQQVSIYPFQTLSSVYANELLYGLFEPGVYNSRISLRDGIDSSILRVDIHAGTTLLFTRIHANPDDHTKTNIVIGKIVVTSDDYIEISKESIWKNTPAFTSAPKLYIIADWRYNILSNTERYVNFSIETSLTTYNANLNTPNTHQLLVATLSNHQYYVDHYSTNNSDLTNYHISYETQRNRNVLSRLFLKNDNFNLVFSSDGSEVEVYSGVSITNGSIYYISDHIHVLAATGIDTYIPDKRTGLIKNVSASLSSYYQVDFLRLKTDINTLITSPVWESFLVPATVSGGINGNFLDYTDHSTIVANIYSYITQFNFLLQDDGLTLLIAVRPRNELPPLWPEHCIIVKDSPLDFSQGRSTYSRFKLPVINCSDIVYEDIPT